MIDADNGVWYEDDEITHLRSQLHVEVYRQKRALISRKIEYRWRVVHRNGNIMGDSSEGYVRKEDCMHAVGYLWPDLEVTEL